MDRIITAIKERLKELDGHIGRLEKSIQDRGDGYLVLSHMRGHVRFYKRKGKYDERQYLRRDQTATIASLAQKKYETRLLEAAKAEKEKLRSCLTLLSKTGNSDMNAVMTSMETELLEYITPDVVTDDGFAKKWLDAKYYRAKRSEGHIYETLNKDMVRSKSEVIIADRLFSAGIPYHYEQRLDLEDEHFNTIKYYPDFTILNKRTREIYYWEHLGNLGDPDYCFKNLTKLEHYSDNGILLGKNLILTFESQNKPLYTANVDRLIKEFLS